MSIRITSAEEITQKKIEKKREIVRKSEREGGRERERREKGRISISVIEWVKRS